jgi:predicted dehydrogenase
MKNTLSWGVIGTGGIAGDFTEALKLSRRCRVVSVAGSTRAKAEAFAARFAIPRAAGSLEELLADRDVEAVYVATPHPLHEAHALACIGAGKAVLCEKPMTMDAAGTERVIAAARSARVFLMEAFMYRCHPLVRQVLARLAEGIIGPLRHLRADFGFRVPRDPQGRLFNLALGGGGILDVGGYPVSFARLLGGVVEGIPFAEPVQITASGVRGPTGADELATAQLVFRSGFTASVGCAVFHDLGTEAVVFGEQGKLLLPNPWIPGGVRQELESSYTLVRDGKPPETITIRTDKATYAIEAEIVADSLPGSEPAWPAMTWADSLGNMRVLDAWSIALGGRVKA